jgi:plastocyanin
MGMLMGTRILVALLGAYVSAGAMAAADIGGTVVIEHKLTRRRVTAPAPVYQRGIAVPLDPKPPEEPLAFERSHVVIYIDAAGSPAVPAGRRAAAQIQQEDRQFSPDLVVIPAGSTVSFPNLDAIFHNIFSLSKARSFDLGNYPKGETRTETFPTPGIVYVYCHLHPNMSATILVSPTQWCARANADGSFVLQGVPPGKYTVVAWHKAAGFARKTVTVTENGAPSITFDIPLTESSPKTVANR